MLEWILGTVAALLGGLDIFQFLFYRSTKKKYEADAEKAKIESEQTRNDFLEKRIESMEKLYFEQGAVVDKLRERVLQLSEENLANKQLIQQLEAEKKTLADKVEKLEAEVQAYRTIRGEHGKA